MIRRILIDIILFLLPFFLYGLYWRYVLRAGDETRTIVYPWTYLTAAGLLLVILSFVWWAITDTQSTDGVYVPPHVEDGVVVPGQFEQPEPQ